MQPRMERYATCMLALPSFRNALLQLRMQLATDGELMARGAFRAFASPLSNVHATGIGIRHRDGSYDPDEYVLKVFVFDPVDPTALTSDMLREYQGVPVDVEQLPIQVVRRRRTARSATGSQTTASPAPAVVAIEQEQLLNRTRQRPISGGVSISPLGAPFVGTLGCFLRRRFADRDEILALSNNHVLADTDRLALGTPIVQPGPEQPPFVTSPDDVFALLHETIPIMFPNGSVAEPVNLFDAALAHVTNVELIAPGVMLGVTPYDPSAILPPRPGMRVVKSGRTTGVTRGLITAIDVDGVQVNYGSGIVPRIAVFDNTIEIVGDNGAPFSAPGDSGSVILDEETGHPVALLFAGDGVHTTACDFGALCRRFNAWPI